MEIIGIIGMSLILVGFLLDQAKIWNPDQLRYDLINFLGSGLLLVYAIHLNSLPFLILNGIWGLWSLRDIILDINAKRW